jgi:hypothetical protein
MKQECDHHLWTQRPHEGPRPQGAGRVQKLPSHVDGVDGNTPALERTCPRRQRAQRDYAHPDRGS